VTEARVLPRAYFYKAQGGSIFRNNVYLGEFFSNVPR
jgi:hypothetical protein